MTDLRSIPAIAASAALIALGAEGVQATPVVITESLHIQNPDPEYGDLFGHSVAISGGYAIIGDYDDAVQGRGGTGAAYLYDVRTGAQIRQFAIDGGVADGGVGWWVGIDGDTAIIGTPVDTPNGAAYLFDVTTGAQTAALSAMDGAVGDAFGLSVDLSANTAIVGASGVDASAWNSGAAYVFDASTGEQLSKLTPSDGGRADYFGADVAIDAEIAIVGARAADAGGVSYAGSAYLFHAQTGEQIAKLTADAPEFAGYFGIDVDVQNGVAVVGAPGEGRNGAAYLFDAATGERLHRLTAPDADQGDNFGRSVALWGDVVVVAASRASSTTRVVNDGVLYLFDVTTGDFISKLVVENASGASFIGYSAAMSDGVVIAAAINAHASGDAVGAAFIFDASAAAPSPVPAPAGLALLMSALGLLGLRRRRRRAERRAG